MSRNIVQEWRVGLRSGQGIYVLAVNAREALSLSGEKDLDRVQSVILWKEGPDYAGLRLTDLAKRLMDRAELPARRSGEISVREV